MVSRQGEIYEYSAIERKAVNEVQDAMVLCVRIRGGIVALASVSGSFLPFELVLTYPHV